MLFFCKFWIQDKPYGLGFTFNEGHRARKFTNYETVQPSEVFGASI
jgi:hypothetical protein